MISPLYRFRQFPRNRPVFDPRVSNAIGTPFSLWIFTKEGIPIPENVEVSQSRVAPEYPILLRCISPFRCSFLDQTQCASSIRPTELRLARHDGEHPQPPFRLLRPSE